ncbi:MAG: hypothetical protein JW981_00215, partial [Anaerolineae bacterium]|nr:hypothetical protein [Anaerolineae bacterium]
MSNTYAEHPDLTCPACDENFTVEVYLVVDINERPDLLPTLKEGTLHTFFCPACQHTAELDVPLLIVRPGGTPPLLFSPAQRTSQEQDHEHAVGLVGHLQVSLGDAWDDGWLAEGLTGIPRQLLSVILDGDDPATVMEQLASQAAQEIERLRQEDPEAYAELEKAAWEMREETTKVSPINEEFPDKDRALADKLITWIQQETLEEAENYLCKYADELLTDGTFTIMNRLVQVNPQNSNVSEHQKRLSIAREIGIAEMYAGIRRRRLQENIEKALQQAGPIGLQIMHFIQSDEDTAVALLQTEATILLTLDTGHLFEQILQAIREVGDKSLVVHWEKRYQQWQLAYHTRVGSPLRAAPEETMPSTWQSQPESWKEQIDHQPAQTERGSKYTVIRAINSAIGDNALVINNVGHLPLCWKTPSEGRPRLARTAVGREAELEELHQRLLAEQNTALISQGTSAALRGQPAIGKTTLAAMYVERYGVEYPGGTLWLEIGPDRRSADDVIAILQHIATYAYNADPQANALLENTVFASDVVRTLLQGHGALLVVIDDVWDTAALCEIQNALPNDAFVLLTTRDYEVAFALEESIAAIQTLDVLSAPDARSLLQTRATGLSNELADKIANGLGRHALALTLAAGTLVSHKKHRYTQTATELLHRVSTGQGFGELPLKSSERLSEVEIAFKYSYDELGQGIHGEEQQAWFRALGTFAQEADFDTVAAAAVWDVEAKQAEKFLLLMDELGLIQETEAGGRWQQHALLRAYALSLQTTAERIQFSERHTDYYLKFTQTCYEQKPRAYHLVELEFAQLQHAFMWCKTYSPRRTTRMALLLDDFMRNRGRVMVLNQWLQTALQGAELYDDRLGKANTLQSLGDLA